MVNISVTFQESQLKGMTEEVRAFTGVTPVRLPTQTVNRSLKSFTLPFATFDHGWDFVPNGDQPVVAQLAKRTLFLVK